MTFRFVATALVAVTAVGALGRSAHAQDMTLNLGIGDPTRKNRPATLVLDAITETATGQIFTPAQVAARLKDAGLVLIGESHTSTESHATEMKLIEELFKAGRTVIIGLEMYPYTEQASLDEWTHGFLTEEGFLAMSHWYANWGFNWRYYRDIFMFAREHRLRMFAINAPRPVVTAVRRKGFDNLTPEEAAHIPTRIDTDSADHRSLFRAFMSEGGTAHGGMDDEMIDSMYKAQCTWDATMAFNAVKALEASSGPSPVMVVLAGSGHVVYGLGIQRQAAQWFKGRTATVVAVPVINDKREPNTVRASYADFVWGVAHEDFPDYPESGISLGETPHEGGYPVLVVQKDSAGAAAGVKANDIVTAIDDSPLIHRETFAYVMAQKRWGDQVRFTVRRGDQTLTLTGAFRRTTR